MLNPSSYLKIFSSFVVIVLLSGNISCYSQKSFDYSGIAAHPRLLLDKEGEINLRKNLKSNIGLLNIHEYIITTCDDMLAKTPLVYEKKGKRLLDISREALTRIFYLSYAYRMTEDKKYLEKAEVELNTVCSFDNWNPTHFLDVAEMTMAVAIGYDWLFDVLRESTKANIRQAIINYAFKTSERDEYNRFLGVTNNWNQVCNSGLVYGALAIYENHPAESEMIIERALQSNPLSLAGYAPDGNYPEGPGYWNYGTSFQVMLIAALESALGSDHGLSQYPGFLRSAEYMLYVNSPAGLRFNYSDAGAKADLSVAMFWFARKQNNPGLLLEEKSKLVDRQSLHSSGEYRLLPALLVFAKDMDMSDIQLPSSKLWSGNGETPVVLVRTGWNDPLSDFLGIKGGSASTNHAHMDAGSFVYDSEGLRWAMDFGMQNYNSLESKGIDLWNRKQDSQRWNVFRLNNLNHNTVTINDKKHCVEGKAEFIRTYDTDAERGGKLDMSGIFKGDIRKEIRKVVLKDNKYLEITDEITANDKEAKVRWTMVTPATVKILDPNTIELYQKGIRKILQVSSENPFELKIWKSDDPGTEYDAKNPGTIMIGFESVIPVSRKSIFAVTLK